MSRRPDMVQKQHYTFGDNDRAAERLRTLARVFEPGSSRLLGALSEERGALGIDLGCGLGFTTELMARQSALERVVGLDQSERLLERATSERGSDRVRFARCDVSTLPFPLSPAHLLYSRFLLTHLRNPAEIVRAWAAAALPEARLVLEETAFMRGEHRAFSSYYGFVERLQAHYQQHMYIGRELTQLCTCAEWSIESSEICVSELPAADMARLHLLNLQTWSSDPFARANYDAAELRELAEQLEQIADAALGVGPVSCGMAQVILRRR